MLSSRRLQMLPTSSLTLDIAFGTAGVTIVHHHAPTAVQLLRASAHWAICNTGALLQEFGNNTECFDCPQGGLWLRGADASKLGFNVGENLTSGSGNWSSTAIASNAWDLTFAMFASIPDGPGSLRVVTNPGGNPLHTYDAGIVLSDDQDLIVFLIGIPGATAATDPTDYAVPYCGTNKAAIIGNVCSGVPGTPGNVRWRLVRVSSGIRYYEIWEKITGTAATYYPGLLFDNSITVHLVAPSQYDAADVSDGIGTHGSQALRGCMVRPDGDAVTTARESLLITTDDPTLLLPVNGTTGWGIALEIAYGLDPTDLDVAEIATDQGWIFSHGREFRGGTFNDVKSGEFQSNVQTLDPPTVSAVVAHGSLLPATPYGSMFIGVTNRLDATGQMWVTDSRAELFEDPASAVFDDVQPAAVVQYTDGFIVGGQGRGFAALDGNGSIGRNADCIVRRLQLYKTAQVVL